MTNWTLLVVQKVFSSLFPILFYVSIPTVSVSAQNINTMIFVDISYLALVFLAAGIVSATPISGQSPLIEDSTKPTITAKLLNSRRLCDPARTLNGVVAGSEYRNKVDVEDDSAAYENNDKIINLVNKCDFECEIMWRQFWIRSGDEWMYVCDAGKSGWERIVKEVRLREAGCGRTVG
jgi:hypothetical protein